MTGAGGATSTYSYSSNDVEITNGPTQYFGKELEYDALGRLTSTCEMSSSLSGVSACGQHTQQTGYLTTYTYDPLGNLTVANQGAQTRSFTYDGLSRMLSEANPENGTIRYAYDLNETCNDSLGDKVSRVDAVGNTTCYYWDGLHRLTQVVYQSGPYYGYYAKQILLLRPANCWCVYNGQFTGPIVRRWGLLFGEKRIGIYGSLFLR